MNCDNYCDSYGNCTRCGECCVSNLPLTRKEEKRIRDYIKKNNIEPEFFQNNKDINLNCCFYDRNNKICKIYEVRPSICKSFKCNKSLERLDQEKLLNHQKAYWNRIVNGEIENLMDMRLLFYNDPRTLISIIIYIVTDKTMKCNKTQFEKVKEILKYYGHEELVNCIKIEYEEEKINE